MGSLADIGSLSNHVRFTSIRADQPTRRTAPSPPWTGRGSRARRKSCWLTKTLNFPLTGLAVPWDRGGLVRPDADVVDLAPMRQGGLKPRGPFSRGSHTARRKRKG